MESFQNSIFLTKPKENKTNNNGEGLPDPQSKTRVDRSMLQALLAGHFAAPLEDALAVGLLLHDSPGVSSIAAQSIAPIGARTGHIALPALGAQGTRFRVGRAEIGRFLGKY